MGCATRSDGTRDARDALDGHAARDARDAGARRTRRRRATRQMRRDTTQAKLALVGGRGARSAEDLEFMQFGTLKMILLEQVRRRERESGSGFQAPLSEVRSRLPCSPSRDRAIPGCGSLLYRIQVGWFARLLLSLDAAAVTQAALITEFPRLFLGRPTHVRSLFTRNLSPLGSS
jgi:hypothetical protein